jgi:hypothetical protein
VLQTLGKEVVSGSDRERGPSGWPVVVVEDRDDNTTTSARKGDTESDDAESGEASSGRIKDKETR